MSGIDRDRGCILRFHPAGFRVGMYHDAPGEYFNEKGQPVSDEVARRAGFETEVMRKRREKNRRMEEFRRKLDAEFSGVEERFDEAVDQGGKGVFVRYERENEYSVRTEAGRLTPNDTDLETAIELYESITGKAYKGTPVDEPEGKKSEKLDGGDTTQGDEISAEEAQLRARYEELVGRKPAHNMRVETMQAKIAEIEADEKSDGGIAE